MAFLEFVNSGRKTYVYINEYVGTQEYSAKKERRIVRLGPLEKAHMQLKVWQLDQKRIPKEIHNEYYKRIPTWIDAVVKRGAF